MGINTRDTSEHQYHVFFCSPSIYGNPCEMGNFLTPEGPIEDPDADSGFQWPGPTFCGRKAETKKVEFITWKYIQNSASEF